MMCGQLGAIWEGHIYIYPYVTPYSKRVDSIKKNFFNETVRVLEENVENDFIISVG